MDNDFLNFAKKQIAEYVSARPDSADTVEGIHQWWIKWPGTAESMAITQAALEQLEQAGIMQRVRVHSREIWRLRRSECVAE